MKAAADLRRCPNADPAATRGATNASTDGVVRLRSISLTSRTISRRICEIAEELRSQYRLGFTPETAATSDGYHEIDLEMTGAQSKNKLTVQTREGYYTGSK